MPFSTNPDTDSQGSANAFAPELASALRRYRLFEPFQDGFLVLDAAWYVLYLNPSAARMLQRPRESLIGTILWQSVPEFAGTELETRLRAALTEEETGTFRCYFAPLQTWLLGRTEQVEEGVCLYLQDVATSRSIAEVVENIGDITERKQAEEKLRESEERFQAFMNNSPLSAWIVDAAERIQYVNPGYYRMFGVREDLVGKAIRDVYSEALTEEYLRNNRVAIEENRVIETIESGVRPDGSPGQFLSVKFPIRMPSGQTLLGGMALDITEMKQAEEVLCESEAQLRAFYETSPLYKGVTELGENDVLHLYDNPAACRFFGVEPGTTAGKWALAELGAEPATAERWLACYRASAETGTPQRFEHHHPSVHGTRWLAVTVCPIGAGSSGRTRFCYIAEDITERKQAERTLKERVNETETLLETIPAAVWIATDPECKRIIGNRASYEILQMPPNSNVSKSAPPEEYPTAYRTYVNGREIAPHEHPMQRAAAEGREIREVEETLIFEDGTEREIFGNASPLFDADGKVRGVVAAFVDISEKKRIEKQLLAYQEWLNLALNLSRMVVWSWDYVANEIETTPNFVEIYGCPPIRMAEEGSCSSTRTTAPAIRRPYRRASGTESTIASSESFARITGRWSGWKSTEPFCPQKTARRAKCWAWRMM